MKLKWILTSVVVFNASVGLGQTDAPDYDLENRFHDIYSKYNSTPTSGEAWGQALNKKNVFSYDIQKGDSLWEISDVLFGDPYFWPKVWSQNFQNIGNPHEVRPQMKIQFFAGSESAPPEATVASKPSEKANVVQVEPPGQNETSNSSVTMSQESVTQLEKKIKELRNIKPVLKELPQSLPAYNVLSSNQTVEKIIFKLGPGKKISPLVDLEYFIHQGNLLEDGKVVEFPRGSKTGAELDHVFVTVKDASVKKYHIVKTTEFIKNPFGKKLDWNPSLIAVQGELEILDVVNEAKGVYRAQITKAQLPVDLDALLVRGDLPQFDMSPGAVSTHIHAQIVGGQYEGKRLLMPNNSLIFINAGSLQGVEVGQSFEVFSSILARNKKSLETQNHKRIALIKVVHVSKNYSTAYVLESNEEIVYGDIVGTPNDQPLEIEKISPQMDHPEEEISTRDEETHEADDAPEVDLDAGDDTANAEPSEEESSEDTEIEL